MAVLKRVALVTCERLPEPDPDEAPLLEALRRAGLRAEMLAWDNPAADSAGHDLCVLRSSWNYYRDVDAFVEWIERADAVSCLANPLEIVRWNLHKRYLHELEAAGISIVPTVLIDRGGHVDVEGLAEDRGWDDVVIKPAVSAASFRTERFSRHAFDAAQRFVDELVASGDAMVQKYMATVESGGERALVWIDGELTHAVVKSARFSGQDERVSRARSLTSAERAVATAALACVNDALLYARVDVVEDTDGRLLVSELELIEPSLFLVQHPPALARLVNAIGRWTGKCL